MIALSWLLLVLLILGPAGVLLLAAFSPFGPLIRYWMFGLFALLVAMAIVMHAGGGVPR